MAKKPDTPCAGCGKLLWSAPWSLPAGQRMCQPCRGYGRGRRPRSAVCVVCSASFEFNRNSGAVRKTCSAACLSIARGGSVDYGTSDPRERQRARWRRKNHLRRARMRGVASEPYTLAEIAERDRFRCQLCRRKVDMRLESPHAKSPTIDHVVPLAEGGEDVRANVQLAHRACNTSKGVRGSQQLALVG